jgi:hypothetical protein
VVMNMLLWRVEYSGSGGGNRVSQGVVLDKIFNAPDSSDLRVFQNGKPLGFVRWEIIPDEVLAGGTNQPVGRVESIRGYTLLLDGRIDVTPLGTKLRFNLSSLLDAKLDWQLLDATVDLPPSIWSFTAASTNQVISVKHDGALGQWERSLPLEKLRDPVSVLESLAGPVVTPLLTPLLPSGSPFGQVEGGQPVLGIEWVAYNDAVRIGKARVRVYRLEAEFSSDQVVTILVSRVGEILRVALPGQLEFVNENVPLRKSDAQ